MAGQNPKPAEHMTVDVFRFRRIFRFLKQLLNPGHTAAFFGLFDAVPYKDMGVSFLIEGESSLTTENQQSRMVSSD